MKACFARLRLGAGLFCTAGLITHSVWAAEIYKADNALPLNDPISWEGGAVPGAEDVAVFDERVTTNRLNFVLTADAAWAGIVFTNGVSPTNLMIGTAFLATNGTDAATLSLGTNGVRLAGSGLSLTLNLPLALGATQTWQLDRRNVTFGGTVSGTADWILCASSQVFWNVASGYSGNLIVSNSVFNQRFYKAGRWAKSLTIKNSGNTRLEMAFTSTNLWSDLFADRTATVYAWSGVTSGGMLTFSEGDSYTFPNSSFVFDNGYGIQNGGTLKGGGLQSGYSDNNTRYTVNGGTLALSGGLMLGNGLARLDREAKIRQTGGTVEAANVQLGYANCKYTGMPTYEMTGGVLRTAGTSGADTGIHLSWNAYNWGYGSENSGAFLMEGGRVETDQIALGRSDTNAVYAITNAFSLFKMTGGELVLGPRGFYAGRTWNNGKAESGYAFKLQGGTLTAGDSWSSALDLYLSDRNGGTVLNTQDTNGIGKAVILNGAVYGPGRLTKRGAGVLTLAGEVSHAGETIVEAGTLAVSAPFSDCYRWTADSLTDTNNAPVMNWADLNASIAATNASFTQAPRLVRNEINGHNAVRFSSGSSQYLAVAAQDSPISAATSFSIAVVFKTGVAGVGGNSFWYNNTGLIDAEQGGYQNDWGLAYTASGQVAGGAGFPSKGDACANSTNSISVVDNQPHVVIFTWQSTNLLLNVDGRVSTAVRSDADTVNPRNVYRMLFGTMNNIYYLTGDMAEIRIYRNRVLSPDEQNRIGMELAATYGVPNAQFAVPSAVAVPGERASVVPSVPPEALPYTAVVWDADSLSGSTGSTVSAWAATNGLNVATLDAATTLDNNAAIVGRSAPVLMPGAINGHHAVRFTGSAKSVLGLPADQNPVAGVTNFSVAFVFRTELPGRWDSSQNWWGCEGLIDAEQPGAQNDWGVSFTLDGRVAGGIGNGDKTVFSKPCDLHDGEPHVVVVSYNTTGGILTVMVDSLAAPSYYGARTVPRNSKRLLLGSVNGEAGKFYTGDLAAFRLYPECALTAEEMTCVSKELAQKYGIRFVSRDNTVSAQSAGLGRGDVEVCSGAALVLPAATNSPVTLAAGQAIRGSGSVMGTLAVGTNAVLEIGQASALTLEDLWLRDGAVVRWTHADGVGSIACVDTLKTAGTATLDVVGGTPLPARAQIVSYQVGQGLSGTVWTVIGAERGSRVEINAATKTIDLVTPKGLMIQVR